MKKVILSLLNGKGLMASLLLMFGVAQLSAQPLDIVVVGNTPSYDTEYVDFVTSAAMRPVVVEYIPMAYAPTGNTDDLSTTMVARLDAADLIILSRQVPAGNFDDGGGTERAKWNGLTTPMLLISGHVARGSLAGTNSNWNWISSATISAASTFTTLVATVPADPIFNGIALETGNKITVYPDQSNLQRHIVSPMTDTNGTVLATRDGEVDSPMLVRWTNTTQPHFQGGITTPAGKRIYYNFQDDTAGQTGQLAKLSAKGRQLLTNVLYDLLPELGEGPPPNSTQDWTVFD